METYKNAFGILSILGLSEASMERKESGKNPTERVSNAEAPVVERVQYRLLQAGFGSIISLTAVLYFSPRKRPINLDGDPSPLGITMMVVSTSSGLHSDP